MVAAAQFGVLAACVVLFVPMGLAGRHLSRNKMLFFSGALFITLALGVHIAPFLPPASRLLAAALARSLSPSTPPPCLSSLHDISFLPPPSFQWRLSPNCGFRRLSRSEAGELLDGSWVVVAGDSQARLFAIALLRMMMDGVESDSFPRHGDRRVVIAERGIRVDFVWAPFEWNVSLVLEGIRGGGRLPEVVVAGSGLWHMLRVGNSSDYGAGLASVGRSAAAAVGLGGMSPHMFWLGMPTLVGSMLNSEEKRERMGGRVWEAYDREVEGSGVLRGSGGSFLLLDVGELSRRCGPSCTTDGMHYGGVVYEAAVQVMLNALVIESRQRI